MNDPNIIASHLDHSRSFDDFDYVYPVISRRAHGVSIGINLNPDKTCNFDCIYCEVDRDTPPRRLDIDVDGVARELRAMLTIFQEGTLFEREPFASAPPQWRHLKDIAFSGDGEPTSCPIFDQVVDTVWAVRESMGLASTNLLLITNASCLHQSKVRRSIRRMSKGPYEIWAKLDAGTSDYFRLVNHSPCSYEHILMNITETARWCPLIIQSLFMQIYGRPPPESEILAYADRLNEIRAQGGHILALQIYTLARPPACPGLTPLSFEELNHIAAVVQHLTGLPPHFSAKEAG